MDTIEMPKTRREILMEIEKGGSIPIKKEERHVWSNTISQMHSKDDSIAFTIRTHPPTKEIRIWRLK